MKRYTLDIERGTTGAYGARITSEDGTRSAQGISHQDASEAIRIAIDNYEWQARNETWTGEA
jgi:predicted RNase H-like HicB family nuclease